MKCPKCGYDFKDLNSLKKMDIERMIGDELNLSGKRKNVSGGYYYEGLSLMGQKYRLIEIYNKIIELKKK